MKSDLDASDLVEMGAQDFSKPQWPTGVLASDADLQVPTCTRQHKMQICCYVSDNLYNSVYQMDLVSSATELCSFRMVT